MDCKTSPFILLPPSPSCFSSSPCSSSFSSYTSCFTELQSHQDKIYPYYMSLKYGGYLDRNSGRNNCSYNDNKSPYWVPLTATRELFVRLYIVLPHCCAQFSTWVSHQVLFLWIVHCIMYDWRALTDS